MQQIFTKRTLFRLSTIFVFIVASILYSCQGQQSSGDGVPVATSAEEKPSGAQLFNINCAQCHKRNEDFTGPALKGVEARWKDKATLYAFIKNSQEVIAKDAYAKGLFDKWKQTYMQPFPQLTDDDIASILTYVNGEQ
ncbi:MAG: c-type cytochrome [Ferruginibacter sp.]|nr:c-type cytochrome [Ferruginibacter sp.]